MSQLQADQGLSKLQMSGSFYFNLYPKTGNGVYSEIIQLLGVLTAYGIKQYQYVWIAKSNSKREIKAIHRNDYSYIQSWAKLV